MTDVSERMPAWRADPLTFIEEVPRNPETRAPFDLYPAQRDFLRRALTLTTDGRLRYPEMLFSAPKKSGKTTTAALAALYVTVVTGGRYAEVYCVANDLEQAQGRVFEMVRRMVQASDVFKTTNQKIELEPTGATITALASDYAGAAGANPALTVFDELWGYTVNRR